MTHKTITIDLYIGGDPELINVEKIKSDIESCLIEEAYNKNASFDIRIEDANDKKEIPQSPVYPSPSWPSPTVPSWPTTPGWPSDAFPPVNPTTTRKDFYWDHQVGDTPETWKNQPTSRVQK